MQVDAQQTKGRPSGHLYSDSLGVVRSVGGRECIISKPGEKGTLVYGPYELRPPGRYVVEFSVALAAEPGENDPFCATLDVVTNVGLAVIEARYLKMSELSTELRQFAIEFTLREPRELEYRVWSSGQAGLVAAAPRIRLLSDVIVDSAPPAKGTIERAWDNETEFLDGYLGNISGLVHIGANLGEERYNYRSLGLDVIWIEARRDVYNTLVDNIAGLRRQKALCALLTDKEGEEYDFNVANLGGSSSILPMDKHAELFPHIQYVESRRIASTTFASLMQRENIDPAHYQALTLDVEGAEMLVLKGAGERLREFLYVKAEVADFVPRTGSPTTRDLLDFMKSMGFAPLSKRPFAEHPTAGTFWDIVWKREVPGRELSRPGLDLPLIRPHWDVFGFDRR